MAKNILIIQCYNANKGDNSVAQTMIETFLKDGYNVSITAFDVAKAQKEYSIPVSEFMFSVWKVRKASNVFIVFWELLKECVWILYSMLYLLLYRMDIILPLPIRKRKTIQYYIDADIVVLPGGHFFTSFNSLINNLSHYYAFRFAQLIGKKTMVYSQTVGPYKGFVGKIEKYLAVRVLRKADKVTLREANSLSMYNEKNCEVTAETVFLKPIVNNGTVLISNYIELNNVDFIVGVTIHHLYFKHYFTRIDYVSLMANIFNEILRHYQCKILIIPMEDKSFGQGDRTIAKEMITLVNDKNRITVIDDDLTSTDTSTLISQMDLFIGTKTHSIVYGLKTFTPTLSISYQQKSTEFMKMYNVEQFAIAMKDLSVNKFMAIFEKLYHEKTYIREQLKLKNTEVICKAERNNIILYKLLENVSD